MSAVHIDGSTGGGQVLRSALSLSVLTGRELIIDDIRKRRSRPGLMRQHLTAARAAAQVCGGELHDAELGSTRLRLVPGEVRAGSYQFAIATAGSASLVLQTVLPPLMVANGPSQLVFEGGTHNQLAPPYCFLDRVFFPVLERMGVKLARKLVRHGFYPAGGGCMELNLEPTNLLTPLALLTRGARLQLRAEVLLSNLATEIGERELSVVGRRLGLDRADSLLRTPRAHGPGNVLMLHAIFEQANELVSGFGEQGVRAEAVAEAACDTMQAYLQADVPVGEHLADQLLIPFAMAGAGSFRTLPLSEHTRSNIAVIEQFLPVRFTVQQEPSDGTCLISVAS